MKNILLIYTGGTIGMQKEGKDSLVPFNFDSILNAFPELKECDANGEHISTKNAIDSSDMNTENWVEISKIIEKHYNTNKNQIIPLISKFIVNLKTGIH